MKYQHTDLSTSDIVEGDAIKASGPFPKKAAIAPPKKSAAHQLSWGLGGFLYVPYEEPSSIRGVRPSGNKRPSENRDSLKANNIHLKAIAQDYASDVLLQDWKRRLPADTKRAFSFLGFALKPGAQVINFRLGHEVAEAALSAKKGPTDYLSALLKTLDIVDLVFVLELASSGSEENHPLHLYGIARIRAAIATQAI